MTSFPQESHHLPGGTHRSTRFTQAAGHLVVTVTEFIFSLQVIQQPLQFAAHLLHGHRVGHQLPHHLFPGNQIDQRDISEI